MSVDQDANGTWWVVDGKKKLAGPFDTNAAAFKWLDRHDRMAQMDEEKRLRRATWFANQ